MFPELHCCNLAKGRQGNKKKRSRGGLYLSIRTLTMFIYILALLGSANAATAAEGQGLYTSGGKNDEGVVNRRDNMDNIITLSSNGSSENAEKVAAALKQYLAKYPINNAQDDDDEVGQDVEGVSFDGSRSLATASARRDLAIELKNHLVASAASTHRSFEEHIEELFMLVDSSDEEYKEDLDHLVVNEFFSSNDDLLEDIDNAFRTRERELKEVADKHSSTIQSRFEPLGMIDGEPQYRFIPSESIVERDAQVQQDLQIQYEALKMKMNKFKVLQKKVVETKEIKNSRQLTTPRRVFDETFTMLNEGERRLSTPEDCSDEDDLCISTTRLVLEASTSIDSVNALVGPISQVFGAFDDLDGLVGTLKTLSSSLKTAFQICERIPYVGPTLFKGLHLMMKALKTVTTNISNFTKKVADEVLPKLRVPLDTLTNTLGSLQGKLNDFSSVVVGVTTLRTPQCMEELIVNLIEFDPYQVLSFLEDEISKVVRNVIEPISTFLETDRTWRYVLVCCTTMPTQHVYML